MSAFIPNGCFVDTNGTPTTPSADTVAVFEAAAQKQAERLYPHSPALQAEWLRAVGIVRATSNGWLLDKPITREKRNAQ